MRKFGLIGNPISHSKSPQLFAAAYPDEGMSYELIQSDSFDEAVARFKEDFDAVNVTSPYKEMAFRISENADSVASRIGAANLLVRCNDGIMAYNTDYVAISGILGRTLKRIGSEPSSVSVLVIGCGGAGKSAALAAMDLGMKVTLANRTRAKAEKFCIVNTDVTPAGLSDLPEIAAKSDVIVYALPARLEGLDALPLEGRTIVEAEYGNPCLKDLCGKCGAEYVPGEEWLMGQAVAGFQTMTGKFPDEKAMMALLQQK